MVWEGDGLEEGNEFGEGDGLGSRIVKKGEGLGERDRSREGK